MKLIDLDCSYIDSLMVDRNENYIMGVSTSTHKILFDKTVKKIQNVLKGL